MHGRALVWIGIVLTVLFLGGGVALFYALADPMLLAFAVQLALVAWIVLGLVWAVRRRRPTAPQ